MTPRKEDFDIVKHLVSMGVNDCAAARLSGVPRSTVRDWRRGFYEYTLRSSETLTQGCGCRTELPALSAGAYSYLLGLYLGDGCISRCPRNVWRLRITLDLRYQMIIDECAQAMEVVMPGKRAYRLVRKGCVDVSMYSKHWPCLFPQHGPGRKHDRRIQLAQWQDDLVRRATKRFLRGLIHSDGCRVVAIDRGQPTVRYQFSNRSDDIKQLFCAALERLDIPWTRPSERTIAIYRKGAVARLDEFIGAKR